MLGETLMALAALAGNTVVAAATTDVWEAARRGFARLLGRGDPDRTIGDDHPIRRARSVPDGRQPMRTKLM
jgi:hypothetical protein